MGGPLGGPAGAVVGGRPDQRVAEHDLVVVDDHDALRPPPRRAPPAPGRAPRGPPRSAAGRRRGRRPRPPARCAARVEALEHELGHPLAAVADRQRVGQHGPPGSLRRFQQVGRLDEHQRVAAARGEQATAHVGAGDAGVDQQLLGDVGRQRRASRWSARGRARRPSRAGGRRSSPPARRRAGRRCRRARGVTAGRSTRGRRRRSTIGAVLGRLGEQVARRHGDGERLDRGAAPVRARAAEIDAARAGGRAITRSM